MLSLLISGLTCAAILVLAGSEPHLLIILAYLIFTFVIRLASAAYIDVFGPVHSEQLDADIGAGLSALPLAIAYLISFLIFWWALRRRRFAVRPVMPSVRVAAFEQRVALFCTYALGAFALYLYVDLALSGNVPLFSKTERYDYASTYSGICGRFLLHYGSLIAFLLGLLYARPYFWRAPPERLPGYILALIFTYLLLTGHRFSGFFLYSCWFLIPVGLVKLRYSLDAASDRPQAAPFRGNRTRIMAFAVLLSAAIALAIGNSYFRVRSIDGHPPIEKFRDRVLVQTSEMWWVTYQKVLVADEPDMARAFKEIFIDPPLLDKNTSIQYLMRRAVGDDRANFAIRQGTLYGGGFPEVMFEISGRYWGFVLTAVMSMLAALVFYVVAHETMRGHVISPFLGFCVLYPLLVFHVSGQLQYMCRLQYYAKLALFIAALLVNHCFAKRDLIEGKGTT
ncbi:MAG: hypothetical protein H0X38_03720 [Planctomycetes bacterium]|nr:hypothetical protein [Planctomycetota bacterium]